MPSVLKWKKIQRRVWNRDGYRCKRCGTEEKLGIHHLDSSGDYHHNLKSNNSIDNLLTLCQSCHTKEHWRVAREKGFTNLLG